MPMRQYVNVQGKRKLNARLETKTETEPVIIGGHIQTTKKDQENHGFGTKNMQETAARNGGKVWWEYEKESKILVTHVQLRYHNMEKTGSN